MKYLQIGFVAHYTKRPASADRTARRQFQATGQPVCKMQNAGDHDFPLTGSNFGNLTAFRAILVIFSLRMYRNGHL